MTDMPRANRQFVPGHVWHVTHRCHERSFLLDDHVDRTRYLYWLGQARERFGLSILNYNVTSNHVHLLLRDTEPGVIAQSMQLIAGRTGQEFNTRHGRHGAFWQDRYHATAVETGAHLCRCIAYIDLNMVRAGAVADAADWPYSGYAELCGRRTASVCDVASLIELTGYPDLEAFTTDRRSWVSRRGSMNTVARMDYWTAALAVGSSEFVRQFRDSLGPVRRRRQLAPLSDEMHALREPEIPYGERPDAERSSILAGDNTFVISDTSSGPTR